MQLLATITALFAGVALAAPQWGPPPNQWAPQPARWYSSPPTQWYPPYPYYTPVGPGIRPGQGGDRNGAYHGGCSCAFGGKLNSDLGKLACDNLSARFPNLYWDYFNLACVDSFGAGVEPDGFGASCQEVVRQFYPTVFGFDFTSYALPQCTVQ